MFQYRNLNTLNKYNTFCLKAKYYQSSDHLPLITVSLGQCVHLTYLCCAVNVLNRENRTQTIQEDLCQRRYELCGGHQHIYAVTPVGRRDSRPVRYVDDSHHHHWCRDEVDRRWAPGADDGQGLERVCEPGVGQSLHLRSELQPGVSLSWAEQTWKRTRVWICPRVTSRCKQTSPLAACRHTPEAGLPPTLFLYVLYNSLTRR